MKESKIVIVVVCLKFLCPTSKQYCRASRMTSRARVWMCQSTNVAFSPKHCGCLKPRPVYIKLTSDADWPLRLFWAKWLILGPHRSCLVLLLDDDDWGGGGGGGSRVAPGWLSNAAHASVVFTTPNTLTTCCTLCHTYVSKLLSSCQRTRVSVHINDFSGLHAHANFMSSHGNSLCGVCFCCACLSVFAFAKHFIRSMTQGGNIDRAHVVLVPRSGLNWQPG